MTALVLLTLLLLLELLGSNGRSMVVEGSPR